MRVLRWLVLSCGLVGCAAGPEPAADIGPGTDVIEVRIVAPGFCSLDGRRVPLEDVVYELRLRCREATAALPSLRVVAHPDDSGEVAAMVDVLRRAAHEAGVHHIELVQESAP